MQKIFLIKDVLFIKYSIISYEIIHKCNKEYLLKRDKFSDNSSFCVAQVDAKYFVSPLTYRMLLMIIL